MIRETWIDGFGVKDMHKLNNKGMYHVCIVGGCHNCQFNVSVLNLLKIYMKDLMSGTTIFTREKHPQNAGDGGLLASQVVEQ